MPNRTIRKSFQNWQGLHEGFNDITRPPGYAVIAKNVLQDRNLDLIQRPGHQVASPHANSSNGDYRGIFNHVRYNKDTGATEEELIAITDGQAVHRKKNGTLSVTWDDSSYENIRVQRGTITVGASAKEATATLSTAVNTSKAFVWITNTKGSFQHSVNQGSDENNNDLSGWIELTDSTTVTAFKRSDSHAQDYVVFFEVWEYVGKDGGVNEFKVLGEETVTISVGNDSGATVITPDTDINDVVVFGRGVSDPNTAHKYRVMLPRWRVDSGNNEIEAHLENGGGPEGGSAITAYASVVEFTGSAWSVQMVDHTFSATAAFETEALSPSVTWNQTFIICSHSARDVDGPEELVAVVGQGATGAEVIFRAEAGGTAFNRISTAFIVSNANMSVSHDDSYTGGLSNLNLNSSVENVTVAAQDLDNASAIITLGYNNNGSNNDEGQACVGFRLTSTTNLEIDVWNSASGGSSEWTLQLIDMPTGDPPESYSILTFLPNSSNVFELDIKEGGTSVSGFPKTYGTGVGVGPGSTEELRDLKDDIDALSAYTCTITDETGGNSGFLAAAVLPIQSGLDLSDAAAKEVTYPVFESVGFGGEAFDYPEINPSTQSAVNLPDFVNPDGISFNDTLYVAPFGDYIYKYDNEILYRAGLLRPSTDVSIQNSFLFQSGTGGTGDYRYAYHYRQVDPLGNIFDGPLTSVEEITLSNQGTHVALRSIATSGGDVLGSWNGNQTGTTLSLNSSGFNPNVEVGDTLVIWVQAQDDLVTRTVTAVDKSSSPSVTVDSSVSVGNGISAYFTKDQGTLKFNLRGATITSADSSVNTLTVASNHNLEVGDTAYFWDDSKKTSVARNITAVTSTTITIDGDPVDTVTEDAKASVSNNLRVVIYRTVDSGSTLKELIELPNPFYLSSPEVDFLDGTGTGGEGFKADTDLGVDYVFPVRSPDPAPKARFLVAHQGLLCAAGDVDNPNTVFFSEPGLPEAFPLATNSFDIPFTSKGAITGMGVDNNILVVFKDNARAYIQGDLAQDTFSIEIVEDGIGCPGHHSIERTPAGLIWLSAQGFQRSINGVLDPDFNRNLSIRFERQTYMQTEQEDIPTEKEDNFVFRRATAINDFRRKRYMCCVPCESGYIGNDGPGDGEKRCNSNTKIFVYDYENATWSENMSNTFTLSEETNVFNAYGGYAIHENDLYFASTQGQQVNPPSNTFVERLGHIMREHNREDIYEAADNTLPIPWESAPQWDHAGEPSVPTTFLRQKTWIADPTLLFGDVTFTVESYCDFDLTQVDSTYTQEFNTTTRELQDKLLPGKARAILFKWINNVLHQRPRMSGYEYEIELPYEINIKNGDGSE